MSTIFVRPLPFTVSANSGWISSNPVSNLNIDHPGLVARSSGTTASFTVNLGGAKTIDTVALIGSTLPAGATVSVTAGGYSSGAVAAFTGFKDDVVSTKTIIQFSPVTTSTVTVSITSPVSFQAQRLVVGKRVEILGIDQNCEQLFEDQSIIEKGAGFTTVEEYPVLLGWKIKASFITDTQWREEFNPLLMRVGQSKPLLFVPKAHTPSHFQHEAVFGRFTSIAKGDHPNSDNWVFSATITGLAA